MGQCSPTEHICIDVPADKGAFEDIAIHAVGCNAGNVGRLQLAAARCTLEDERRAVSHGFSLIGKLGQSDGAAVFPDNGIGLHACRDNGGEGQAQCGIAGGIDGELMG